MGELGKQRGGGEMMGKIIRYDFWWLFFGTEDETGNLGCHRCSLLKASAKEDV